MVSSSLFGEVFMLLFLLGKSKYGLGKYSDVLIATGN